MWILLNLASVLAAVTIEGTVTPPRVVMERLKGEYFSNIKLYMDGGASVSHVDTAGTFSFQNVEDGTHLIEATDLIYSYRPVLVVVNGEDITVKEASPSPYQNDIYPYPLQITPDRHLMYFEEREPFSIMKIIMNPYLLVVGAMVGLMLCMPKMKLDPEQMKEMQELQKNMNNNWFTSFLQPPQAN